jgi:hypothetical protein
MLGFEHFCIVLEVDHFLDEKRVIPRADQAKLLKNIEFYCSKRNCTPLRQVSPS